MKLEKRNSTEEESPVTEEQPTGKKPVVVYIMILFIVAFLLMALSFLMHQRSNTEVLGKLQNSVTVMEEVQGLQERVIQLQEELSDSREEAEALENQLKEQENAVSDAESKTEALLALYTLQQHYAAGDLEACLQVLDAMEEKGLASQLPEEADVTSPAQRYQQLKEAVEARLDQQN